MNEMTPAKALAARYYTDPKIFERVRDEIFFKSWQFACHESQIPEPGDYYAFTIVDQDFFVIRQKDRSIRCFYNVCQHRAHQLVSDSGRARLITCPYHAWSYGLDGALRGGHALNQVPGFDKKSVCLTSIQVEPFCGFVFVNMDADAPSMTETFPGVEEAIRALCPDIEDRVFADSHAADEFCNWMVAVENYNECYHCEGVHPTFATGVIDPLSYDIAPFSDEAWCLQHKSKASAGDNKWYDTSGSDYGSFYLWPTFSLQIYPSGLVNTYHWRPEGPQDTKVFRGWFSRDGVVDDAMQKVIDLDRDTTFAEDLVLVKSVQRGLTMKGYRPGPLVVNPKGGINSETSIMALHRWLKTALGDG